jgi:hypothetical protein
MKEFKLQETSSYIDTKIALVALPPFFGIKKLRFPATVGYRRQNTTI